MRTARNDTQRTRLAYRATQNETFMDKNEASKYLGISTRMIERYEKEGKLSTRTIRVGRTRKNIYDETELSQLKSELNAVRVRPKIEQSDTGRSRSMIVNRDTLTHSAPNRNEMQVLAVREVAFIEALKTNTDQVSELISLIKEERQAKPKRVHRAKPLDTINLKLTLSFTEAAALAGVPTKIIKELVSDGNLVAVKVGRGYRVHRNQLDNYFKNLFMGDTLNERH